ncbi:FAD-dependent oxidoreductase [Halonatronum saccharophilum]|uniref:FAD-dependent oxidoreductase n=1 Tax=Halonatronum saccharophilum TaxID=150060 RepID=UPI00048655F8|nr:FAD-dependent oxidoreductase [Halonatronum saccharophilum]
MKVAVIGCTHAGTSAIVNIAQMHPEAQITVYERNDNISFLSCGIALYVGGVVEDTGGLFYSSPEELSNLGVKTNMLHNVLEIDVEGKKLKVRDMEKGKEFEDKFDKLIVTTGSWPVIPPIEGIDLENVILSKNFAHANDIIKKADRSQKITVVGAGYIGVELVESFQRNGKEVTLIDMENRILSKYLDKEFTDPAEEDLTEKGIILALGERVTRFKGDNGKLSKVITDKGEYKSDLVILCIGFNPNTELLKGQIDLLDNGAIVVDEYMRTSKDWVYAAGDCCAVKYNPTEGHKYIPLATNAIRMGRLVAQNLVEPKIEYPGTQGTSGIKIYRYNIAATGLTEITAKEEGIDVKTVTVKDNYRPEFMPKYEEAHLKVVYHKESRVILGAQIISKAELTQFINTMSVVIQNKMTIDQLALVDFFFQPYFNKPWNLLNMAGLNAK